MTASPVRSRGIIQVIRDDDNEPVNFTNPVHPNTEMTIFVTGFPGERNLALARLERPLAQDILMKPFDPADLLTAIDTVMRGQNANRRVA